MDIKEWLLVVIFIFWGFFKFKFKGGVIDFLINDFIKYKLFLV